MPKLFFTNSQREDASSCLELAGKQDVCCLGHGKVKHKRYCG